MKVFNVQKLVCSSILLFALMFGAFPSVASAEFPSKPIRLVVYTSAGGLIDITARKLANIIQRQNQGTTVIVENKKGAGGLVALSYIANKPADGHTVFGLTNSVISKAVAQHQEDKLDNLTFVSRVVKDYECLITQEETGLTNLKAIRTHASSESSGQRWVGPDFDGTDHLFAKRVWKLASINGKWIPYKSGGEAIAALMGGHGHIYVGNPQDIAGRPGLTIAAVSAPERLPEFPDTPTFEELGYGDLTGEVLWRGFAVRKSTPPDVISALEKLFKAATDDPEWLAFVKNGGMIPVFDTGEALRLAVKKQIEQDKESIAG